MTILGDLDVDLEVLPDLEETSQESTPSLRSRRRPTVYCVVSISSDKVCLRPCLPADRGCLINLDVTAGLQNKGNLLYANLLLNCDNSHDQSHVETDLQGEWICHKGLVAGGPSLVAIVLVLESNFAVDMIALSVGGVLAAVMRTPLVGTALRLVKNDIIIIFDLQYNDESNLGNL